MVAAGRRTWGRSGSAVREGSMSFVTSRPGESASAPQTRWRVARPPFDARRPGPDGRGRVSGRRPRTPRSRRRTSPARWHRSCTATMSPSPRARRPSSASWKASHSTPPAATCTTPTPRSPRACPMARVTSSSPRTPAAPILGGTLDASYDPALAGHRAGRRPIRRCHRDLQPGRHLQPGQHLSLMRQERSLDRRGHRLPPQPDALDVGRHDPQALRHDA